MNHRKRRPMALVAVLCALTITTAACGNSGSDKNADGPAKDPVTSDANADIKDLKGDIKGSGATFPDALYQEAIAGLADVAPDLTVTYNGIGSSSGKEAFAQKLNDFAGSDSLVKDDEGIPAGSFFYIPSTASGIAVVYNLKGVELQLDGPTIAKIFGGKITSWDDPAIKATNEDVDLPATKITVARRSDGSGTTKNFTKYLDAAGDGAWTLGSDDTVEWPASTQGGQGNPGVAQIVKGAEGTIGYVDFGNAQELGLEMVKVKNKDGKFVAPSVEGTQAALEGAELSPELTYDPLNAAGAASYPITAPTYILVRASYEDATVGKNVVGFVRWLITDGTDTYAADLGYAPLPESIRTKALAQLEKVKVG